MRSIDFLLHVAVILRTLPFFRCEPVLPARGRLLIFALKCKANAHMELVAESRAYMEPDQPLAINIGICRLFLTFITIVAFVFHIHHCLLIAGA